MGNPPVVKPRDLIDPRADSHLLNWAEWMQNYRVGIGYGHKSAGLCGYGSETFDDLCDKMDREHAKVINAIIEGLPQLQQVAIHNEYLADVWRSSRTDMVEVFVSAVAKLWELAQKRGLS